MDESPSQTPKTYLLCWHCFAGVLPGWHGIVGDKSVGRIARCDILWV